MLKYRVIVRARPDGEIDHLERMGMCYQSPIFESNQSPTTCEFWDWFDKMFGENYSDFLGKYYTIIPV